MHDRHGRRLAARGLAGLLAAGLLAAAMMVVPGFQPAEAAESHVFFIDSLANDGSDDVAVGDGECRTAANTCSLRAALQEANALPSTDPVTITPADGFSGEIFVPAAVAGSNRMATNTGPNGELGAVFVISRPLTIDMQNRVSINGVANQATAAFRITAPAVQMRNIAVSETSTAFSLSAAASGSTFDTVACAQVRGNLSRCLALANNTNDVTIRRSVITHLLGGDGASIRIGVGGATTIRNLTVDRVRFINTRTGTNTQAGIVVPGTATTLPGLRIIGSTFEGFEASRIPIDLSGANVVDGQIVDNQFINNGTVGVSFPTILINTRGTNSVIAHNYFTNGPGISAQHAVRLSIASSGLVDSGWRISENYFDGYRAASVASSTNSGLVTIDRNTFGPTSFGGGTDANESNTAALVSNGTANQSARTWFPTAVAAGPEPCTVRVSLAVPTVNAPTTPVSVDVYATAGTQAETYLGRATGLTTATDVVVPFSGSGGNIRVQTVGLRGATSQYSRVMAVPPDVGNCAPAVTFDQAATQESPTSYRDVAFDAQFSEPIPGDLSPAAVDLSGTTAPGARVVRVDRLTPSAFRVVVHADASGTITAALPAGVVVDGQGNPSSASTSTDNSVEYVSPLSLDPAAITVTKGDPGESYTVRNTITAREPITVTPAAEHPEWVGVGPGPAQIPSFRSSGEFTVSAPQDGQFTGDRTTVVRHTVSSDDENFDGLILDPVTVTILDPNAPDSGQSSLDATTGSRVADGTDAHTVTATARSATGVALRNATVLFQAPAGVRLSATSCLTGADGTCTVTATSTVAGSSPVTASIAGTVTPSGSPVTVNFVPGPPDLTRSTLTSSVLSLPADGVAEGTQTVTLYDAQGNRIATGGANVEITRTAGTLTPTQDRGDGTYDAVLTAPTVAGETEIGFTLDGQPGAATLTIPLLEGEPSPTQATIDVDPNVLLADGAATSTVRIRMFDSFGNPVTTGGAVVDIDPDLGGVTTPTDLGDGTYEAIYTAATTAGRAHLTFTVNGALASATAQIDLQPGPASPVGSTITVAPVSIPADGHTQAAVTVELRDINGNRVDGTGHRVDFATTAGTLLPTPIDNGDGTFVTLITAPVDPGNATISFLLDGVPAAQTAALAFVVGDADPSASTVVASPTAIPADGTSTSHLTVTLRDSVGNPLETGEDDVLISASDGTVGVTIDNGDGTYTADLISSTTAATSTVTFTVNSVLSTNTATVGFLPGAADPGLSTIVATPDTIRAGGVETARIDVTLRDQNNNVIPADRDRVDFTTTLGDLTRVDPQISTAQLTSVQSGTAVVGYLVNDVPFPSTASVLVEPGAGDASRSSMTISPTTVIADGVDAAQITVDVRDASDNVVTSGADVQIIPTRGDLTDLVDNGDGTWTASLTSNWSGSSTVVFTVNGVEGPAAIDVTFIPGPVDLARSQISVDPAQITADGVETARVLVTLLDANGNLITADADVQVVSSLGTVTPEGQVPDGAWSFSLTGTVAGTATLTFTVNDAPGGDTATVVLVPGAADPGKSTITASPVSVTADGSSTSTVMVRLFDANNNALTASGGTVVVETDLGGVGGTTDNLDGTYTATLTAGVLAGTATLTFTLGGLPGADSATVALVPGAADPGKSTITASPVSVTADGSSTSTVTVRLFDANDNALTASGGTVVVETDLGGVGGTTDNLDGTYTATLTAGVLAGTATLTFTLGGLPGADSATVALVPGAADPDSSTIEASPTSITADGSSTSTVTVRLFDANNNALTASGGTVVVETDLGAVSGTTDNLDGTYTATLTAGVAAGTATLTFTLGGLPGADSATVALVPGAADPDSSTIEASPTSITADGSSTSTVTVRLFDANNNALTASGGTVVVETDLGAVSGTTDNLDGTYTATLTAGVAAGTATLTFTLGGLPGADSATVALVPGAPDVATSTIAAVPSNVTADGVSASTVTVSVRDRYGNLIPGGEHVVDITTSLGTVASLTDRGDGTWTASLISSRSGLATLSFTIDGDVGEATTAVIFAAGAPSAQTSTVDAAPTTVIADGITESTITVRVLDANGNAVRSGALVALRNTQGSLGPIQDLGDGTWRAQLVSTVSGVADITMTINGAPAADSASVTFVPGPADPRYSTLVSDPHEVTADGTSTSTITLTLRDAQRNPVLVGGQDVAMQTTAGMLGAPADLGNGTWTAVLVAPTSTAPPAASVSFSIGSVVGPDTALVAFVPGIPDGDVSVIAVNPAVVTADGAQSAQITVELRDAFGNPVTGAGDTVGIETSLGTVSAVSNDGGGTYSASLTSSTSGVAQVTFTVDGVLATPSETVTFVPGPADPARSTITATPTTISANGVDTSMLLVTLTDAQGNRLEAGGDAVDIIPTAGTRGAVQDNGDGTYAALLLSDTSPGPSTVSFTVNTVAGTRTTVVTFAASIPDALYSMISAAPATIGSEPSDTSQVVVTLYDADGLRVTHGDDSVDIRTSLGTLGAVVDRGDGTYTAVLSSPLAGVAVVGFLVNGALSPQETSVVVKDTTPPDVPTITTPAQSAQVRPLFELTGSGEPLATVTVRTADGVLCTATVDAGGSWSCVTGQAQPEGALVLSAFQTDVAGNVGPGAADRAVTVVRSGPAAPDPDPTDGRTISGRAEPGTTVYVSTTARSVICSAPVDASGAFSCTANPPLAVGALVVLVAVDSAGNISPEAMVRVGGASVQIALGTVQIGQEQEVLGEGFLPGESVEGTVYSTPRSLGSVDADESGTARFTFVVDADFSPGAHTVTLVGERSGTVSATFEVVAAPAPTPAPSPVPSPAPHPPVLSLTGVNVWPLVWVAVLLAGVGLTGWAGARRRMTR